MPEDYDKIPIDPNRIKEEEMQIANRPYFIGENSVCALVVRNPQEGKSHVIDIGIHPGRDGSPKYICTSTKIDAFENYPPHIPSFGLLPMATGKIYVIGVDDPSLYEDDTDRFLFVRAGQPFYTRVWKDSFRSGSFVGALSIRNFNVSRYRK